MPPFFYTVLFFVLILLVYIISFFLNKYDKQVRPLTSFIPSRLLSLFFDGITLFLAIGFVACIPELINKYYNLDNLRHSITDKRHPVTQDDIFQALQLDHKESHLSKENMLDSICLYTSGLDSISKLSIDSLTLYLEKSSSFKSSFEMFTLVYSQELPSTIKDYYFNRTLNLANTKYETVWALLFKLFKEKDSTRILSLYDLVYNWKWDRNLFNETIKKDTHELDRNYTLALCMYYVIDILEEQNAIETLLHYVTESSPDKKKNLSDSLQPIKSIIFDCAVKGTRTGINVSENPYFFFDKKAEYAYSLRDPKADKYADEYINVSSTKYN